MTYPRLLMNGSRKIRGRRDARPIFEAVEPRLLMASMVYTVTNTNDTGAGSLRQAIINANSNSGVDTINFAITTTPLTIQPLTALPFLTEAVTIDGTTQTGYAGRPVVTIDGSMAAGGGDGLGFNVGNSAVKGLGIVNFSGEGLSFRAGGNNTITGDVLAGNGDNGLLLADAGNNQVGGTTTADAVVISGNRNVGIYILGPSANNVVQGSYIGTDATGTQPVNNGLDGIFISGSPGNTIGGVVAGSGNVIAAGSDAGVQIFNTASTGNLVAGNSIGLGVGGQSIRQAGANRDIGVFVNAAPGNSIGGTTATEGNVISGMAVGVEMLGGTARGNLIAGNRIGTNAAGTTAVGNLVGVYLNSAPGNTVGGLTVAGRNVISGNTLTGINLTGTTTSGNLIVGNYVGLDAAGVAALGNGRDGIFLNAAPSNTIGGTASGSRNYVGGDAEVGIQIAGASASGNLIQGNSVGLNAAGTSVGTGLVGIFLNAAPATTIGGTARGAGNTISGGAYAAIEQTGATAVNEVIQGNTLINNVPFAMVALRVNQATFPTRGMAANRILSGSKRVLSNQNAGPAVLRVLPTYTGSTITGLTLTFSKTVGNSAQNPSNYQVSGPNGAVGVSSATVESDGLHVTLQFAAPVSSSVGYRLVVVGHGRTGVTDAAGHRLDGRKIGRPSGDFATSFGGATVRVATLARRQVRLDMRRSPR